MVARYYWTHIGMDDAAAGAWVHYDDYAALQAENERLKADRVDLRRFRDRATHRVYRGSVGYLPCYCHADADHMIGDEQAEVQP